MADKDPSPFGYTFSGGGLFDSEPSPYEANNAQSLLSVDESQRITDFFNQTDPFFSDLHAFDPAADTKASFNSHDFWDSFVTPPTVHQVSTIPDQSQLHNNFFADPAYAQPPLPAHHLGNTHDDLQAASTLFRNSQSSYADNASSSFHPIPSPHRQPAPNTTSATDHNGKPLVITQHGVLTETLASILPNHAEEGSLDAQFAAQWAASNVHQLQEAEYGMSRRPHLKRSYTFGTDDSFNNPAGYSLPNGQGNTDDQVTQRLMRDLHHSQPFVRSADVHGNGANYIKHEQVSQQHANGRSEDEPSEDSSEPEEDEKPAKKRRKSKPSTAASRSKKTVVKTRKSSTAEETGKKKRATAAQKLQRENLTEEQKRNNHIHSEQKRRNLIKGGFSDLNGLVPELRNGGLSKSGILTEAANFLEKLIEDNKTFQQMVNG